MAFAIIIFSLEIIIIVAVFGSLAFEHIRYRMRQRQKRIRGFEVLERK